MRWDLFKTKAKHSITGLTLACSSMAPCAMAQNQTETDETDAKQVVVLDSAANDDAKKANTYLDFAINNVIGVQTTGKEVKILDRASLGFNTGFEKNKWHGDLSVAGDFMLRNKDITAKLTQATVQIGRKTLLGNDMGIAVGREYTEKDLFDGPNRFIDYTVADIHRDHYGNLSDKLTLFYKGKKGLLVEAGAIEQADSSFYLVPNLKKVDFFGKVGFEAQTNKNINIVGSGAVQLGNNNRKIMTDFGVNGSNFSVVLGANYDINNENLGFLVSGNYISKRDFRYILSLAKYYWIYVVQAGVEKKNVMLFVTVNTAKNYANVNAGLSWRLDYKQKVR